MTDPLAPQRTERILLPAMEEVLGEQGLQCILDAAQVAAESQGTNPRLPSARPEGEATNVPSGDIERTAPSVGRLLESMELVYGAQAGRGLSLRVGRACFQYALLAYGDELGLTGTAFRLLPLPSKFRTFAVALTRLFNKPLTERIRVQEQDGKFLVHLLQCPLCRERRASEPLCQLAVGLAEEALYWLSGGKIFQVDEIACAANGNIDCTLQIDAAPIS